MSDLSVYSHDTRLLDADKDCLNNDNNNSIYLDTIKRFSKADVIVYNQ